ncbi:bifunctional 2',3'-cyclic-nucleotide 2'-phosphodiesterase/3'-nucleotidase [Roseateles sp. DAIF2]|uniref:bifunctional 2',3'-cyclic-nucleotide 2'-phosphodiesterase/3'-nucleotidase n=1 Tax=Roseateles sp. DAIF2 TaxID=2714952 RepID=UPI0018A285ED|nr:bifunctional 2',3'-cyclic-nucleotide 2'-phosphodiesterase/3'-nucleotidase [Roseateles sp. DAIF2]QPF73718.1 bifunctional 2',3'-cyclic-nucleotide 2'-phosphodiesterase/3'-nucleotidase [Roseateles sp. DAIF2]
MSRPTLSPFRLLAGALLGAGLLSAQAAELKLRILQTTDVHMNLLNYDYYQDRPTDEYGLAKAVTLIKAARAEAKNSLLFDNGDLLQGNPLGDVVARVKPLKDGEVHPAYKVLNLLEVDAANIGNHEFNYGLPFLRQAISGAKFPYVSANVVEAASGKPAFEPYVLLERRLRDESGAERRLKIGVIGFVPPQIMLWDRQNLEGKVRALDIVETAQRLIPELRAKGADLVVVIAHSGIEKTEQPRFAENVAAQLAQVPGIDALLLGHAHAEFPGPAFAAFPGVDSARGLIHGVPSVMPGRWGDHLGVIDLSLDDSGGRWQVVASQASIRPIFQRSTRKALVEADPAVGIAIAAEHQATLDYVRSQVAITEAPIHSFFAQVGDDPSVQVVAQAQLDYAKRAVRGTAYEKLPLLSAAAPFKSGGRQGTGHYTDIPAGPVAIKHVADLYVYPNTVKVVKVNGAELREWLEMSAGQFRRIDPAGPAAQELLDPAFRSYNFDMIEGVSYQIDVSQPARYTAEGQRTPAQGQRIVNLRYRGKPVDPGAEFLVVTNNYRASGGGNFPALGGERIVVDAPDENREALAQYLAGAKRFNPSADGNWQILPVKGVKLRFLSGAGGIKHLARTPSVKLVEERGDGSALYELAD